ncbi:AAA family ATPase [Candidatus Dojkabacteria bacterium]|nr:AAA family ATPase [Candidatus Dojkabacteria bacterium]
MKFINREKEIKKLEELWRVNRAQLVIVHGKRRVGKTELIKRFIEDGKGIYYLADKRTHQDQLIEFARVVGNYFNDEFVQKKGFGDWIEAFIYLKQKSNEKKFVVVIDEYPYLVEAEESTSSVFQKIWDEHIKDSSIFLILCGSSMTMMESELLSYKAPLYGRLTAQLLIEPMDYESSMKFFPKVSFNEFVKYYTITGGMPAYLESFADYKSVNKAVENLCWDKQGLYHDEVNIALKQELRKPNIYFSILKAISEGNTRITEIANRIGEDRQLVNKYIDSLMRLQFVKREVPVNEDKPNKSRKGLYFLTENFVRFWFQYLYAFRSDLEMSNFSEVSEKFKNEFNLLESNVYEEIARSHVRKNASSFIKLHRFGRYWDSEVEIDGLGFTEDRRKVLFMEAKWSNSKVRDIELTRLFAKSEQIEEFLDSEKFYILYSKSGFSDELINCAKDNKKLLLVEGIDFVE